jgi:hypothetical protein
MPKKKGNFAKMSATFMERQSHHELANVTLPLSKNHTGANADRRGRAQFHCRSGTAPPQLLHTTNVAPPLSPFQHLETTRGAERQAIWKAQSTDGEKEEKAKMRIGQGGSARTRRHVRRLYPCRRGLRGGRDLRLQRMRSTPPAMELRSARRPM